MVKLYKKAFGVPEDVLSVMCARAVLLLCASGLSNESISAFLELDRNQVNTCIKDVYEFDGWEKDLEFNPLHYLKIGRKLHTRQQSKVCRTYLELYSKIEPYYK